MFESSFYLMTYDDDVFSTILPVNTFVCDAQTSLSPQDKQEEATDYDN